MNVQQKRAGTGGDSDHSAWTKIKKIAVISKRTINSTQKNEAISLSGTGSQVCLTSCRSKEIITPNCSDGAGKEDSVCPLSDDHFLNRMKEVSYLGSDKVLLVKVTKNRNDTDGIKGKSLSPLLQEEKYSLEHFGKRVKLTSKRKSNEESKINVTRLERREPDSVRVRRVMYVDKVDVSVGDDTVNLVNHSQTSHEANRLVRKIVPITLGNYKESLGQPILKQRSQNSSLSASSCDATVTKPVISISNMITKKKGAGEGCLKYIPVCTQSGSNSLAVSEVVAFSNKKKILPGPSYEMLNTSHQLPESTSVLDENLRESNEGIYLNEGCNTKEMQEKSASLYFSEEEATSEMYTLNNDKRKTNDQNEYSSLSEVSSEPLGGWLYTPDNSQDAVDSLLEDLYDGQDPDKPFPDIDNLDCFIPLTEEKNSTFQDLTTSTLDKCLEETILNSPNTSLVEFMNSSQTPTQFVVDGESLKKNSQGSPDFTELIFKSMNQVSSKTDVVLQEDFSLQPQVYSSPLRSLSHGNTSHECPLNNIRDLICDSLSTSTGENKKGLFTDYNQLLMGASEELCAPVGHSTNITVGEAVNVTSSSFSSSDPPSNASHFVENMLLQSHINETDSNSLLKMNRISRVDGCEAVGPSCESSSEVVWILQTPKPSLAPLSGLYLDKNEVSIENEAQCNSRLPENLTNKETYVDINQSSLVNHCRNVVDTNTSTNPLGLNQEGNSIKKLDQTSLLDMTTMQPSRLNIPDPYPCEVMTICGNLTTEKLDHVEVPMFTNLTDDDDSNFNNKHFLPDDSPILRYPELISEILDVQRNCEPAHLNQQGCSSGNMRTTDSNKEVKSLEAATLSEEPSSSGVNSPSYFNDLLDSFLQEVEESNTVIDTEESNTVIDTEESNTVIDTEESNAGIDSDKKSCAYTMNERKNICGQNTAYTLMLNREGNNSRSQDVIGDILSDLGGLSKGEGVEVLQHDTEANSASGPLKTVTASPASTSNSVQKDLSDNNKVKRILKKQRVIRPVLFRTLPGIRPIKCATQGQVENGSQKQMKPLCFILGKDRRLQNQDGSSCWPQREDFKPEHYVVPRKRSTCSSKDGKQLEDGVVQTVVSSTPRVPPEACGVTSSVATAVTKLKVQDSSTEGKSFVLPVGKTGLSISIPINTPTNIPSFFASANLKSCTPSIPSPTTVLPCIEKGPAEAAKITTSIDSQSPALVTNIPQGKKAVFEHQDTRKTIVPTTVFTVGGTAPAMYQVSIPQSFPTESFYMMIPTSTCSQLESGSSTPLNTPIVPSILPRLMSTQPCSNNPVVPTPVNNCSTGKQLVTKYCLKSYVHPIAPKTQQVNSVSYVSAKGPILLNTATSEPVKILINTQPSIINDINCYSLSPENGRSSVETSGSKPRLKSEYVHSLQQKLLKKKPNSDSFKNKFNKSRLLRDELQHHFPDIPESILKLLNLPPKAICRGYFNLRDLKTLHTQALTLRLSVTLRDHISVCKLHNCPTCIEFLRQKKVLSSIEREKALASKLRIKSGRGRSRGRGGRRGRDEPPHTYLAPSKRKLEDVSCNINNSINMKISRADKAIENPDSVSKSSHMDKYLCRRIRVRRSNSESDIHVLLNTHPQKTDEVHSCDDSCLGLHHTLRDSHSEKWLRTEKENSSRNSKILTKRKFVITAENRWKKFQCDNMLKTAAQDLLLKKQLEQDFVAFAEEAVSEKSPKQCGASTPTTLHFNLHALYIGPLNLAAKCNPIFHPKLHVIYSARKFVYEFVIWPHQEKQEEEGEGEVVVLESAGGITAPHLSLTLNIPFSTLQAIAITSNKVQVVVNTVPSIQVICRKEASGGMLCESGTLSPAHHDYLAHLKAALSVCPLHNLVLLDRGRGVSLHDGLCGFSTWFSHKLSQHLCVEEGHIPSWLLAPHLDTSVELPELSSAALTGEGDTLQARTNSHQQCTSQECSRQPCRDLSHDTKSCDNQQCCNQSFESKAITSNMETSKVYNKTILAAAPASVDSKVKVVQREHGAPESLGSSNCDGKFSTKNSFLGDQRDTIVSSNRRNHFLDSESHDLHRVFIEEKTKQGHALRGNLLQGVDNGNENPTSDPSSLTMLLNSAVEPQKMLHPVPFTPALQFPMAPYLQKGCNCKETCRIMDCPCARAGALCNTQQTCLCKECDNPLNILHTLGLDVHTARVDECLMQNLYSYGVTRLYSLLVSQVILPCCGATPELLHIMPGTVMCNWCGMAVCYSWCTHHIHMQSLSPRNHCLVCCSCRPTLHTHCQKCQLCTPSSQGMCTECGTLKMF